MTDTEQPLTSYLETWKCQGIWQLSEKRQQVDRKLGKCYKKLLWKTVYCLLVFGAMPMFTSIMGACVLCY